MLSPRVYLYIIVMLCYIYHTYTFLYKIVYSSLLYNFLLTHVSIKLILSIKTVQVVCVTRAFPKSYIPSLIHILKTQTTLTHMHSASLSENDWTIMLEKAFPVVIIKQNNTVIPSVFRCVFMCVCVYVRIKCNVKHRKKK